MRPVLTFVLAAFLPLVTAAAQDAVPATVPETVPETAPGAAPGAAVVFAPLPAAGLALEDFVWEKRPVVVFADSPNDPAYKTQMRDLAANPAALAERDVVVITDTDPKARTAVREALHPRGFSLVVIDKHGAVAFRKPLPWEVREIAAAIDKLPLRREEMLQQRPAGR